MKILDKSRKIQSSVELKSGFYQQYKSEMKSYKLLLKTKAQNYYNIMGQRLVSVNNTEDWWRWLKEFKRNSKKKEIQISL